MIRKINILTLLLAVVLASALSFCTPKSEPEETRTDSTAYIAPDVTYEIFIQSFADSDGNGIGDFTGAASKLDYLKELGIEAIWLMPIMPSPSYHKYDVTDYRNIHPDYGTLEDFKKFVEEAHKRDIQVIIDLVINHSSDKHPWFLEAVANPNSQYRNYYVWANKDSIADQIAKKETTFDSDNITQWHAPNGDTTALHYYGFFTGMMPDLNFDNPELREEIYDIGKFWLIETGVDGFRLDAAKHIYPDDRQADNTTFWREFLAKMKAIKPDVYTVGEVWANAPTVSEFVPGFRALFDFDLAFSILESVNRQNITTATISGHGWAIHDSTSFISTLIQNQELFKSKNPEFTDAIFLSNHDQNRYMSFLENNTEKAKLATSILLTLPGQPYLYYGEEIGMRGKKPDENIREPFLWSSGSEDFDRTKWINPVYTTDSTVRPMDSQLNDPESMLNHYKKWIRIRNEYPVLKRGLLEEWIHSDPALIGYIRKDNTSELYILHNLSTDEKEIEIEFNGSILEGSGKHKLSGRTLKLEGVSSVILVAN